MRADKLFLRHRFTIFQEHFHYFAKVRVERIQRFGLGMGSGESGDVGHEESSLGIVFDTGRVFLTWYGYPYSLDLNQTERLTWGEPLEEARNQE